MRTKSEKVFGQEHLDAKYLQAVQIVQDIYTLPHLQGSEMVSLDKKILKAIKDFGGSEALRQYIVDNSGRHESLAKGLKELDKFLET